MPLDWSARRDLRVARSLLAALAIAAATASACSEVEHASHKSSLDAKSDDKPRPTENGEGVPGYLSNSAAVHAVLDGDLFLVQADPGTVRNDQGAVEDVVLCLQQVPKLKIDGQVLDAGSSVILATEVLAKGNARPDGSFELRAVRALLDPAKLLVLSTGPQCGQVLIEGLEGPKTSLDGTSPRSPDAPAQAPAPTPSPQDAPSLRQEALFESGIVTKDPPPIAEAERRPADTIAVYDLGAATFKLRTSNEAEAGEATIPYGHFSYVPFIGDWDGDARDDIGVAERGPAGGKLRFLLRASLTPGYADYDFAFGSSEGTPVAGDWDGDGRYGIGVFEALEGRFSLRNALSPGEPDVVIAWGQAGDVPVAGDWDGDGDTDIGVFRPSTAEWILRRGDGTSMRFVFGHAAYKPVVGDWDGDGRANVGVQIPDEGKFVLLMRDGTLKEVSYGSTGNVPLAGTWTKG